MCINPSRFLVCSNGGRQEPAIPEQNIKVKINFIDNPTLYIIYQTYYERKQA